MITQTIRSRPRLATGSLLLVAAVGLFFQQGGFSLFGQKLDVLDIAYHKTYDGWWDVACDSQSDGSDGRCYVQYVDVYSDRPDFRAAMVHLVYEGEEAGKGTPVLTFNLEGDLDFSAVAMRVETSGQEDLALTLPGCSSSPCIVRDGAAQQMVSAWRDGETLSITLPETGDRPKEIRWPLQNMATILDDLAAQRAQRSYP